VQVQVRLREPGQIAHLSIVSHAGLSVRSATMAGT
jgi:hypothetical protein